MLFCLLKNISDWNFLRKDLLCGNPFAMETVRHARCWHDADLGEILRVDDVQRALVALFVVHEAHNESGIFFVAFSKPAYRVWNEQRFATEAIIAVRVRLMLSSVQIDFHEAIHRHSASDAEISVFKQRAVAPSCCTAKAKRMDCWKFDLKILQKFFATRFSILEIQREFAQAAVLAAIFRLVHARPQSW